MSSKGFANEPAGHDQLRARLRRREMARQVVRVAVGGAVALLAASRLAAAPAPNRLADLAALEKGDVTTVTVKAKAKPVYSVRKLKSPPRLIVELANCELGDLPPTLEVNSWVVGRVATDQLRRKGSSLARLTVDLRRPSKYSVRVEGRRLVLRVVPRQSRSAAVPSSAAKVDLRRARPATRRRAGGQTSVVRDIRFIDGPDRSKVRIELSGAVRYRLNRLGHTPAIRLYDVTLPKHLRRKLEVSAVAGAVRSVSSYAPDGGNDVFVQLDLRAETPHDVRRQGNALIWEIAKPAIPANARNNASAAAGTRAVSIDAPKVAASRSRRRSKRRRYRGRRIDLDFKDADIHNILRLLSDVGAVNIITSDAVGGRVTIRMKDVPWDQALDVILRAKGLGQVREGNLVRVAPLSDLEKERESELARQKQLMLLQPLETRLIPLSYAQAQAVLPKLQYTLSPRGKVTFDERTNMVIARDISSNLNLLERMIRNLDTQTPQVVIESRVVEARTNYSKEIGIQWGGSFTASSATGNSTGLVFPNQVGVGGGVDDAQQPTQGILLGQAANPNFAVNMPAATGLGQGSALGLTLGSVSGAFNVNLRLSAAESTGDIRIISAPKITTLDNVEAKIEQGISIPYSQVSANGVQTQFRDAKLSLTVKPHVTADASVFMKVKVERNEPDFVNTGARGDPSILKKQAETEMLVKDGDTAVIGGIYTTRDGRSWQKVPWLADIPILGWLFKTRRDSSDREEVLVFITPRIINRAQSIGR